MRLTVMWVSFWSCVQECGGCSLSLSWAWPSCDNKGKGDMICKMTRKMCRVRIWGWFCYKVPTDSTLFSKQWSTEQEFISGVVLNKSLHTSATPAIPSKVPQIKTGHKDWLGNILEFVGRSNFSVCADHPHVQECLDHIQDYPILTSFKEFHKHHWFCNWESVCEVLLVLVRLHQLVPNKFQCSMIGLYFHECAPTCCCQCGLTPG